ncbi:beta-lactamase family protein [Streptosporangium sp. NBC_01495]|uniref:serine hydrolase domain-containing protein n=1 Tax=Streptosporangium sp. NBC_01495 TaxID=2903899 RepID=UPI002E315C8D|nr:serine hydrolase domain-containing protein [Streptosporangium sp. NBC_01495]
MPASSERPRTPSTPEPPGSASALQTIADDLVAAAGSPGAVVHIRDDGRVQEAASGFADPATRTPMRVDHRFRIASITKTFTATIALQLVRERRLALRDTLGELLPGVLPGAGRVTVEQLLTHTSGIPDYLTDSRFTDAVVDGGMHTRDWPPRELLGYGGRPGRSGVNRYSNGNFILLGLIIEKVTGQSYAEALRERVTEPLKLRDTELPLDLRPPGLATGRQGDGPGATVVNSSIFWSAGGLVSTAGDVGAFYEALFGGKRAMSGDPAKRPAPKRLPEGAALKRAGGLGVFADRLPCGTRVWNHSGMVYGYSGIAMSSEDGRRQVVVQLNSPAAGQAIAAAGRLMCR